jgi:hypothetical protein
MALAHTDAHRAAELKERQTQLAHTNGRPPSTAIHSSEAAELEEQDSSNATV